MNYIKETEHTRIEQLLQEPFNNANPKDTFLLKELERYIPEFNRNTDQEIREFASYQKDIYLRHHTPEIGRIIACLNPTFIDSPKNIKIEEDIFTIASKKENGYRMQLHIGEHKNHLNNNCTNNQASAYTRQFTPYDLRLFPELQETLQQLPVMIGDCELINKRYEHLAGFNRVQVRLPNATYWPTGNSTKLDDQIVQQYLTNPQIFNSNSQPQEELELTLSFHSLFAIANPLTWNSSRQEQLKSLISFCDIPKNYKKTNDLLNELQTYLTQNSLNAKVSERLEIKTKHQLTSYITKVKKQGLEGICVSQFQEGNLDTAKTHKIKNYETIDAALLGLYLHNPQLPATEDNLQSALLGLYDKTLQSYIPAFKVNLDSTGVQIKTNGQKERLDTLRCDLASQIKDKQTNTKITRLYDIYHRNVQILLEEMIALPNTPKKENLFQNIPRGCDFGFLLEEYQNHQEEYQNGRGTKKTAAKKDIFIQEHLLVFETINTLPKKQKKTITTYLNAAKIIKTKSQALLEPHIKLDTADPIILEAQVFDIKYNLNPFAAGFNLETLQSFHLTNCFAERIRYDKRTTTDYETIKKLAKNNTAKI